MNFIELRDKVVKIKREIEDMDRFEEEEMKKIRPVKNTPPPPPPPPLPKPIRKKIVLKMF